MQIKLLRNHATLRSALNHKACRRLFEAHLTAEYSEESIRFYDAVDAVLGPAAAAEGGGRERMASVARSKEIVSEYVVDGAGQQVNIPGKMREELEAACKADDLEAMSNKLRDAQDEIYLLMARDNWPRFTKTKPFEELLSDIGSYASMQRFVCEEDLMTLIQDCEGGGRAQPQKDHGTEGHV